MWNVFLVSSNSVSSTPCSPYTPDSYWSLSDVKCPKKVTKSLFGDSLLILVCNIYWYSVSITSTSFTIIPYHSSPWWCDWVHNKWVNSFLVQCTICMFLCCHHQPPEPLSNCLLGMGVGWVWGGCRMYFGVQWHMLGDAWWGEESEGLLLSHWDSIKCCLFFSHQNLFCVHVTCDVLCLQTVVVVVHGTWLQELLWYSKWEHKLLLCKKK